MTLLKHRSAPHAVVRIDDLDVDRRLEAAVVGGEELPRVVIEGGSTDPIDELLHAVASGDQEALAALESRMGGLVRVNIRRVLRDAARSDEVTQEFFADVPREVTNFDPDEGGAQAWLLTRAYVRAMNGLTSGHAASS